MSVLHVYVNMYISHIHVCTVLYRQTQCYMYISHTVLHGQLSVLYMYDSDLQPPTTHTHTHCASTLTYHNRFLFCEPLPKGQPHRTAGWRIEMAELACISPYYRGANSLTNTSLSVPFLPTFSSQPKILTRRLVPHVSVLTLHHNDVMPKWRL